MNIDKSKIDKASAGEVEVINIKLDEKEIPILLNKKGFYPSYHMNKKNWITIILDDTLSDDEIMKYINISHSYTETVNEWIVPANPKYYDIESAINSSKDNTFMWKPSNNIKIGDLVYLYIASPISAIKYKCQVEEANISYNYSDKNIRMSKVMKLKLLKKYNEIAIDIQMLKNYGIKTVRGPRNMPSNLKNKIEFLYNK